jgi:hypothetical protein
MLRPYLPEDANGDTKAQRENIFESIHSKNSSDTS